VGEIASLALGKEQMDDTGRAPNSLKKGLKAIAARIPVENNNKNNNNPE
jgi:hypothetical protein